MDSRKMALIYLAAVIISAVGGWYLLQPEEKVAPNFSLVDPEGNVFRLNDFRGKVVVIDFMATWCGPCRLQMAHFKIIWEKYGGKIILMSIDIDPKESGDTLRAFAQQFPYATWIWVGIQST